MRMTYTLEIHATPEDLWPFLENPAHQKKWMKGLIENRFVNSNHPAAGVQFLMEFQCGRKTLEYEGEIINYRPPRHLTVVLSQANSKSNQTIEVDYQLAHLGTRTHLRYMCAITGQNLFMQLLTPVSKLLGKMQVRKQLQRLKIVAETQYRQAAAV